MIKAIVFIEGEPYRVTEFENSEKLFDKYYESHWGLTKKECGWDLNRTGMFLCPVSDKRKYKSKKAILLVPKAEYFGEQISTNLKQYEFIGIYEDMFDEIKNYIIGEERDSKLNELGI